MAVFSSLKKKIRHWQVIAACLILCDFISIHVSYFFALWLRADFRFSQIPHAYLDPYTKFISLFAAGAIIVFIAFRLYRSMWRFASFGLLVRTVLASATVALIHSILITAIMHPIRMPHSYYFGGFIIQTVLLIVPRFSFRLLLFIRGRAKKTDENTGRVMIIGAGEAGQMILRDLNTAPKLNDRAVCFIDDNPNKWGRFIEGVPIEGGREDIPANVKKYKVTKIFLAIPTAKAEDRKNILGICAETDCEIKQLPALYQIALGQVTVKQMKDVAIEDLLGRDPIKTDLKEVFEFINNKVVMVTGGGGSIGSELCRQIAAHRPKTLIIFDIYENSTYAVQLELKKKYPDLDLKVFIGSVRDSRRLFEIFSEYRPQVVYHAAAHKHVPLMEDSPNEAIKNNTIGTFKTAYAAMIHGCERFVLISTDKAVNPTNIMGASKRMCEMVVQSFDSKIKEGHASDIPRLVSHSDGENDEWSCAEKVFAEAKTQFVAVRFGNVLGSNGSVVPIFKKQIEQGGPVTVTHPEIVRYFMTIEEAVSLVLLAGTYASGGEIFVLDMGSPVKIDTLARNLIKLSGFKPDEDIKIVYTGLRPGEKLYEEKLMAEEGLQKTDNDLIHVGKPIPFGTDEFLKQLLTLMKAAYGNDEDIRSIVEQIVPTYHPENAGE